MRLRRLTILLVLALTLVSRPPPTAGNGPLQIERFNLVVFDLEVIQPDLEEISALVSEIVRNSLIESGKFQVVERSQIQRLLKEQEIQFAGITSEEHKIKLGNLLQADFLLTGAFIRQETQADHCITFSISMRLLESETGRLFFGQNYFISEPSFIKDLKQFVQSILFSAERMIYGPTPENIQLLVRQKQYAEAWRFARILKELRPQIDLDPELRRKIEEGLRVEIRKEIEQMRKEGRVHEALQQAELLLVFSNAEEDRILAQELFDWQRCAVEKQYEETTKEARTLLRRKEPLSALKVLDDFVQAEGLRYKKGRILELSRKAEKALADQYALAAKRCLRNENVVQARYYATESLSLFPLEERYIQILNLINRRKSDKELKELEKRAVQNPLAFSRRGPFQVGAWIGLTVVGDPKSRYYLKGVYPEYGLLFQFHSLILSPLYLSWAGGINLMVGKKSHIQENIQTSFTMIRAQGTVGIKSRFQAFELSLNAGLVTGILSRTTNFPTLEENQTTALYSITLGINGSWFPFDFLSLGGGIEYQPQYVFPFDPLRTLRFNLGAAVTL